jgi:AcrR family transcriptional regulator
VARTVGSSAPETRRRILDSATAVFAEHGYAGASMRDIAERLGITKAALYYHFTSKEDLLDGLVHPVMTAMSEFAQAAESGALTNGQILSRFLKLTIDGFPGVFPLMIDPGARLAIKARYDLQEPIRRIEVALAGGTDPERMLCAQFILGGIRSMVVSRLLANRQMRCDAGEQVSLADLVHAEDAAPLLNEAECAVVVRTALAGLASQA